MRPDEIRSDPDTCLGFSLLELMIVTCLIGVLAAIGVPNYIGFKEKARISLALTDMRMIEQEVEVFLSLNDQLPDNLANVGLDTLRDPWDRPYQYLRIQGGHPSAMGKRRKDMFIVPVNTDFDLFSLGPDGASRPPFTAMASRDDLVRANNGSFYGVASDY